MISKTSQAFQSRSSSNVIAIPTRHDPKSGQHVVRWKDIQQCFKDAQYVLHEGQAVMFLTDDDLEDLIPLRIAHHPSVVLEVVGTDDNQVGSSSMGTSSNNGRDLGELSGVTSSSIEAVSVTRDVSSMTISRTERNQTLVVRPQDRSLEMAVQPLPSNHFLLEAGDSKTQQETLHLFQRQVDQVNQKMEEVLERIQQTDQRMEEILRSTQQADEQRQHTQHDMQGQIDNILQTLQQMDLHKQEDEIQHASLQQLQHQIEMVQQKMQQLDQETQDSRQQMHNIQQQMQQQIDKVLIDVQKLDQKAHQSQQQNEQLLKQMHGMGVHLSPGLTRRETQKAFSQFVHARCLVQDVLAEPSAKVPIPRLFIILPAPTTVDEQGGSCSFRFRLYFLCECGSHTMTKACDKPHEVHLSNHHGYDLDNQDEFINKYGSYLLTMMYMVKHGAKTRGLTVSPLLGLNHANGENENIGQLVDDTITYLQEATGCIDRETTAHQSLDATELANLKSYLKSSDGECFSGGLSQMKVQKGHYVWICSDHWRECFEPALQQLKSNLNASGGVWKGKEVKVSVTSAVMARLFYNSVGKMFKSEILGSRRSLTEVDSTLDSPQSVSNPMMDILDGLDGLESLSLDFDRFTMTVKDISGGDVQDVVITIKQLDAPTSDDLEFIQQCRPTALRVLGSLELKDEIHFVNILQRNLSITSVRIDCDMKRCMDVIDLVKSTRGNMLQSEDKPALRILELVHPEIKVKVLFKGGSPAFDVDTYINMETRSVDPIESTFIRQYGWSITTLVVPGSFSDPLAKLLYESVQEKGSRITHLDMTPSSLTTPGLDAMNQVIDLSPDLTYLRLSLENLEKNEQRKNALDLLRRHKDRLTALHLAGALTAYYLSIIACEFPKDGFPSLKEYFVNGGDADSNNCGWFTSIGSTRMQRIPLKAFGTNLALSLGQWDILINALDFSELEELHLACPDISRERLEALVDCIADYPSALPLRRLYINGWKLILGKSFETRALIKRLREKIPETKITGIESLIE
ncbi:hypothetical protein BGX34_008033 [Mortierella sp. NVP85]|nr:hypothetical protein BGX34_008033 [Mortierella sp. NVP85]